MALDPQLSRRLNSIERSLAEIHSLLMTQARQYLNYRQVAELCAISDSKVRELVKRGTFSATKIGGRWAIPADEVASYQVKCATKN